MNLDTLSDFIFKNDGIRVKRLPIWNPSDDNPRLTSAKFEIKLNNGNIMKIESYLSKNIECPNYFCGANQLKDKFAVYVLKRDSKINLSVLSITDGFVDLTLENLQKFIVMYK